MALTLTNITLSSPADKSEVEQNFYDIQQKFNANITNADIASNAAISSSKIETRYERMIVTLKYLVTYDGTNARVWADLTAGDIVDVVPIPGDGSDANWVVRDATWACNAIGLGDGQFRVEWGYYDATATTGDGTWNTTSTPISATTITASSSGGADTGHQAHIINGGTTELAFANSPNVHALALIHVADGTTVMDSYGDFLTVTITLRRAIGVV